MRVCDRMTDETAPPSSPRYRAVVLAMLLLVYTFNFLDRQILGILAVPIKADLGLSDTQLGALGGIAFALLYSTLAIPLALLADRTSRTWVITVSLAVWAGFTALCGLASSFLQLFLFRIGVGVGEAGGVAPSYASSPTISRRTSAPARSPSTRSASRSARRAACCWAAISRSRSNGAPPSSWSASSASSSPSFRLVVREPARPVQSGTPVPVGAVFGILAAKRGFWFLALGAACSSMCGYGVAFWLPSLLMRSFGLDLLGAGQFLGGLLLLGGVAGVLLGGFLGDRMGGRDRAYYAWVPAVSYVIGMPLFVIGVLSDSVGLAFALFLVPQALVYVWLGPVLTAVQHLVPAHMRASASATFLLINNLVGLGLGSWAVGSLSDALAPAYGQEALRYAIVAVLGFYLLAGLFMALAGKALRRDWVAA